MKKNANPIALLPVAVFLVIYLGLGIVFDHQGKNRLYQQEITG